MRCRIRCGIVYEHDRLNTHTHTSQMRKWNANVLTSYGLIWLSCVYLTPSVTCQCRVLDAQKSMPRPAWTPSFAERDQHTMLRSCSRRPSLFSQLVVLESINRRCVERNHEDNSDSNGISVSKTVHETQVARVLQPNGVYIAVSHGQPSYRLTYLQRPATWLKQISQLRELTKKLTTRPELVVQAIVLCLNRVTLDKLSLDW